MASTTRARLLAAYRDGHAEIMALVSSLPAAALDRHRQGEWSVRQIIHHLADTEVFRPVRLRQLLSQDAPIIQGFDELKMAESLHYGRPVEASLALFDASVRSSLELLALMSEADWAKAGTHTDFGPFTMEDWLDRAAIHLPEHAAQLRSTVGHA
jgi:hypothetical protein